MVQQTSSKILGFLLAGNDSRTTNGTAQLRRKLSRKTGPQNPLTRSMKYEVSSGIFAYQISMYWQNQMYIQNVLKANSSLPRSCKCSWVRMPRNGPSRSSQMASMVIIARPPKIRPAKGYKPQIVLYQ